MSSVDSCARARFAAEGFRLSRMIAATAVGCMPVRPQSILHFFLNDRVAVDVGLIRRPVDVEPDRHSKNSTLVPGFPKSRNDWI